MSNKLPVTITAVWVRNTGERIEALVEIDGEFVKILDDYCGPMEFAISHIVEGRGILSYQNAALRQVQQAAPELAKVNE